MVKKIDKGRKTIETLLNDINKISYELLIEEPFYGHLFVGFVKKK